MSRSVEEIWRQAAPIALELEEVAERLEGLAESGKRGRPFHAAMGRLDGAAARLAAMVTELDTHLHDVDTEAIASGQRPPVMAWALQERFDGVSSALAESVRALRSSDPPLAQVSSSTADAARTLNAASHLTDDALLIRWIEDRIDAADPGSLLQILASHGGDQLRATACSVGRHLHRASGCAAAYPVQSPADRLRLLLEALEPCEIRVRIGPREGRADRPDPDGAAQIHAFLSPLVSQPDFSVEVLL